MSKFNVDVYFTCFVVIGFLVSTANVVGFFTPYWMKYMNGKANETDICWQGVAYNVHCPDDVQELGWTVRGLQIAALGTLVGLHVFWIHWMCCCMEIMKWFTVLYSCLYPTAGIVGFAGCMVLTSIKSERPGSDFGWSFYVSLSTCIFIILQNIIFITCCVLTQNTRESCNIFLVYRRKNYEPVEERP